MKRLSSPNIWMTAVILTAGLLFFPFLSIQWDPNGIIEAHAVQSGGNELLTPNHILFRPVGFISWQSLIWLGVPTQPNQILQLLTAGMACLGVGFFFRALLNLTGSRFYSLTGCAFLATSWSYWVFSTDIYYITPTAMVIAALMWVALMKGALTLRRGLVLAILTAFAVLLWQASIFLAIWIAIGLYLRHRVLPIQHQWLTPSVVLGATTVLVGFIYLLIGSSVLGLQSPAALMAWLMGHSSQGTVGLWGTWSVERTLTLAKTWLASFIPLFEGLGMRAILKGEIRPDKIPGLISLLAFITLLLLTFGTAIRSRCLAARIEQYFIHWMLTGVIVFLPFLAWWDPYEAKWFVIPNLFLIAAFALIWAKTDQPRTRSIILGAITVIALTNFAFTIYPRHVQQNKYLAEATCVAAHLTDQDRFAITDWNWNEYAHYFFGFDGEWVNLLNQKLSKEEKLQLLIQHEQQAARQNGNLYIQNFASYTNSEKDFAFFLTGLTEQDLNRLGLVHAFDCGSVQFMRLPYPVSAAK